jgi:hypothetical protein
MANNKNKKTGRKDKHKGTVTVGKPSKKSGKGSKIDKAYSQPARSQDPARRHAVIEDHH